MAQRQKKSELEQLAELCGLQLSYEDVSGSEQRAEPEQLLGVLKATGLSDTANIIDQLRKRKLAAWQRPTAPVVVVWQKEKSIVELRLPGDKTPNLLALDWRFESGETSRDEVTRFRKRARTVEGSRYWLIDVPIERDLPSGYHELRIDFGYSHHSTTVFAAPRRCYSPPSGRYWGVFAPLYAAHSQRSWGVGDLTDLELLHHETRILGGHFVGTLPILASFLDEPLIPSPYSPVSRLFWNEFYLDVNVLAASRACETAENLLHSDALRFEIERLQRSELVDYQTTMRLKRSVLEAVAGCLFENEAEPPEVRRFLERRADAQDYALFRAVQEKQRKSWRQWPGDWRTGTVPANAYDESARRYHLFVQSFMDEQIRRFSQEKRADGLGLYLDFPLGVHPDGFDVWQNQDLFAIDASVGAPPDAFFTKGQNWGFPPIRPDVMREQEFRYFIDAIRHHLSCAGMLRLDHVMALHRLFWIPEGGDAKDGVYVQYPAEELYAILAIESNRSQSVLIGEDLGTVPAEVRTSMKKRGVRRMYVLQYELSPEKPRPDPPQRETIASLNTHDMPTFKAFWEGLDVDDRLDLELLDDKGAEKELEARKKIRGELTAFFTEQGTTRGIELGTAEALEGSLQWLSASDAEMVLINLEDLWLEEKPQNVPGTSDERPNWKRKLRYMLEEAFSRPEVRDRLVSVNEWRKRVPEQKRAKR